MRTPRMLAASAALVFGLAACDDMPAAPALETADQLGEIFASATSTAEEGRAGLGTSDEHETRDRRERDDGAERHRRDDGRQPNGGSAVFDRLAAQIEGFAGMYRVGQCSIVLVLTAAANVDEAIRIVHAVVEPLVARTCPSGIRVTPERGTYTYAELHRFHAVALPLVDARGVYSATVNYQLNAVLITVASREIARRVQEQLVEQGVPADALEFRIR